MNYYLHNLFALADGREAHARNRLRDNISEHGFAVFEHDGISPKLKATLRRQLDIFFARPLHEKLLFEKPEDGHQRGYTPPKTERARDQPVEAADLKEFWQQGPRDFTERELLPDINTPWPGFDSARRRMHTALGERVDLVLTVIAPLLDVTPEWLIRYADGGDDIVRYLRYFELKGNDATTGALRSAPHTDINLITLLKSLGEGLVVRSKSGREIELDIGPDQLVVQMGDFMEMLSGGLLPATTHWVKNMPGVRTSVAYFDHPAPLQRIDTLPHLRSDNYTCDAGTERHCTWKRLIEIGIFKGPSPYADECVSRGYTFPPSSLEWV